MLKKTDDLVQDVVPNGKLNEPLAQWQMVPRREIIDCLSSIMIIYIIKSTVMEQQHQFRSLATADPSLVAQTSSFLAAARAESDKNAKKPKTSGFMKPKDDEWTLPHRVLFIYVMCATFLWAIDPNMPEINWSFYSAHAWLLKGARWRPSKGSVWCWWRTDN